jgi:hypothetical protein
MLTTSTQAEKTLYVATSQGPRDQQPQEEEQKRQQKQQPEEEEEGVT